MRLSSRATLAATALALALPAAATPSLIGHNVTINWLFPDTSTLFATTTVTLARRRSPLPKLRGRRGIPPRSTASISHRSTSARASR